MIYLVVYIPNCEERYIMFASKSKLSCKKYIDNFEDCWRKNDMSIMKIKLDEELDFA